MALVNSHTTLKYHIRDTINRTDLDDQIEVFIQSAEARFRRDPRLRDPSSNSVLANLKAGPNWLITAHPDVYIYGTLLEAAMFLLEDERVPGLQSLLESAIAQVSSVRRDPARALAISTYAELQTFAADVLDRSDLKNVIPVLITLAEAGFRKDSRVRDPANNASLPALSSGTNWLLTAHPDIYLYGVLVQAEPYLGRDARIPIWKALLEEALEGLAGSVRLDPARTLAVDSYASIQTMIADYLNRGDLKNVIPVMITMAERFLANDRRVRNLATVTFSITGDDLDVPSGFQKLDSWYHDGPSHYGEIEIVGAGALADVKARRGATGAPTHAAILNGSFRFAPAPGQTYSTKMTYWQTLTPLSAGANWLSTNHPHVYVFAALVQSAMWTGQDPTRYEAKLEEAIEGLHQETWDDQWSGAMRRQITPIGG